MILQILNIKFRKMLDNRHFGLLYLFISDTVSFKNLSFSRKNPLKKVFKIFSCTCSVEKEEIHLFWFLRRQIKKKDREEEKNRCRSTRLPFFPFFLWIPCDFSGFPARGKGRVVASGWKMTDIRSFFKPKPDTEQENCQSRVNSLVEAEGQSAKKSPGRLILSFSS